MKPHYLPFVLFAAAAVVRGQEPSRPAAPVAGRQITHREQSLKPYDPFAAEELFKKLKIPPAPALAPADALKSFQVAPGFRIECVAHEPLVEDPVCFEFDPDGRMWVVEMRGWMLDVDGTGEGDPIGRITVLEDTDGDTFLDRSTVFLDGLVMPRTVSFVAGGVLVAEPPHLWYCRDLDGDLKCDEKKLVGKYGQPGNPEHTDNGLFHALDNWMYNAKSTWRHRFKPQGANGEPELIAQETLFRGQWGMTQDDVGRLFYNYENSSLHADLVPTEYLNRNKNVRLSRRNRSLVGGWNVNVGAEANEVFPIRVTPGITLGGTELREDGTLRSFTIACGPTIYRGEQFPSEYYGAAVVPEAGGNLVRLDLLEGDGAKLKARNAFDRRELVASTDERFRPVCARTGPDGALYVCDLYRGIIEHVIFMMPYLRNQILSRGLDKHVHMGRIYRIVHESRPLVAAPKRGAMTSAELVDELSQANGVRRDTAQRLLVERGDLGIVPALQDLAIRGSAPLGRLHALWTLEGLQSLQWLTLDAALHDADERVLAAAIRLSERAADRPDAEGLWRRLQPLLADRRSRVQLQLLATLGSLELEAADRAMIEILAAHPTDLFRATAAGGLQGREFTAIERLLQHEAWSAERETASGAIEVLSAGVVNEGRPERIERLLQFADAARSAEHLFQRRAVVTGVLASESARNRWPTAIALSAEPPLLQTLAASVDTEKQAKALRRIITWPGDTTLRPTRPVLEPLTPAQEKRRVLGEAVYNVTCFSCHKANGLGQAGQAPPLVDSEWVNGPPERLIRIALHGLQGPIVVNDERWDLKMPGLGGSPVLNDQRMAAVLTYVRRAWDNYGGPIEPEQVAAVRAASASRQSPWTADELEHPERTTASAAVEADPLEPYRPLLAAGNVERGRVLFHQNREIRCNACHKVGESGGGFVGPDLTEVGKRGSREYLLESLVSPSAKIAKGFDTLVVVTQDGTITSGTFVAEDDRTLTLAPPTGGKVTIPVKEIDERIVSPVSSMPPMGKAFSPEQIADLVAYLESLQPAVANGGK